MFKSTRRSRRRRNRQQTEQKDNQPFFSKSNDNGIQAKPEDAFFQAKLSIGQPGDKYEQEADAMADAVVSQSSNNASIQQKKADEIQRVTLATPEKDEQLATAEGRMEEDKLIQEKSEEEESVQMMEEEEESVQMKKGEEEELQMKGGEEEEELQMKGGEEEEELQMKAAVNNASQASAQVSNKIEQQKGKGNKLPDNTRSEMEKSFGVDFSDVNIHTDSEAVQMNKQLGAQAFATGKDIYFNSGKYRPETGAGKHLLAHELTHVVQQNGDNDKISKTNSSPSIQASFFDTIAELPNQIVEGAKKIIKIVGDEMRFQQMWDVFPRGSVDDVKSTIGGRVDADWITNTCAIRVSRVLNYSGHQVPFQKGETISGDDKKWYFYRIRNLRPFIEAQYGAPDVSFRSPFDMSELAKHKGIIQFDETNFSDATGHFTLWNGSSCADSCYFDRAGVVHIWHV